MYSCEPANMCQQLGITNNCLNLSNGTLAGCCCNSDACIDPTVTPPRYPNGRAVAGIRTICNTNNTDITPVTPTQIPRRDVIACFQGLHVNNISIAESYTGCVGDCASLTVQSSVNGDQYNVTLYTCDPTTVCQGLGIVNRCAQIPNTPISGCCCDSDVCIQPYQRKYPNGTNSLQCGAGLTVDSSNYTNVYQVQCDGTCASVETTISGARFVGYFCAPTSTCKTLDLRNDCLTILGDAGSPHVTACCCDYQNYCNTERNRVRPMPYTPATNRPPIACWGGLGINNNFFDNSGRYMACQGDCGMMTFRTSIAGQDTNVTMYSCDPVGVCDRMYLQNACGTSPTGIFTGCCCDWNDCIDIPNRKINPYPLPSSINCYIGLGFQNTSGGNVTNIGGQMSCDGQCGTLVTDINGIHTYGYYCAPQAICSAFDVWNECTRRWLDYPDATDWVDICCCNNADNCNFQRQQPNVTVPTPTGPTRRRTPISCYSGLSFLYNNTFYGLTDDDKYMACQGDCAQLTYQSFLSGNNFLATVYTCDPVSLCATLGIANSCTNITKSDNRGTGISGCCCNWNDCINKNNGSINPQPHKNDLQCFVGVQLQSNPMNSSTRVMTGASMPCNGECASVKTHFGSYDMWSFMCAPQVLCDVFDTERECGTYQMDAAGDYLETCCCARWDNCNIYGHGFPVPSPVPSIDPTTSPIACYAGFALNRNVLTPDNRFMACQGQCAQLTYGSRVNGNDFSATIFTCDPAALCNSFNMSNSCGDLQNNGPNGTRIRSCCCGWSDCIDRSSNSSFSVKPMPHWHKDDLNCYVGLSFLGSNGTTSYGSSMGICNGECMSVETMFNGVVTIGFFCSSDSVCDAIDPTRGCATRFLDRSGDYLKGCCCADTDNCNTARYGIDPGMPVNTTGVPVLGCLAGINYNGVVNTADRYMACQGDCASLTFSSTINGGQPINLTMFMCDPVQMCAGLRMQNRCHRISQQGSDNSTSIRGCCCQWNDCIDPNTLQIRPYPLPTSTNCFIGLSFQNGTSTTTYGGPGQCDGQCGSLVTTVSGVKTYGYYCAPQSLCSAFELWNECTTRFIDSAADTVDICCCNSGDSCNINNQQPNVTIPTPTPPATRGYPLSCYSGLTFQLGGTFYNLTDSDKYMSCFGNCAAVTYATTANNASFAATMYTCDPQYLCPSLGLSNQCVNITGNTGNGISGCCCNWNDCINKTTGNSLNPYPLPTSSNCFIGLSFFNQNTSMTTTYGGQGQCDGQCGTLVTTINGIRTYGYYCAPQALCSAFEVWNDCTRRLVDSAGDAVDICCCNGMDNCNIMNQQPNATLPTPVVATIPSSPLACYAGLTFTFGGQFYNLTGDDKYMPCFGNCAAITYNTTVSNSTFGATMFTCDPVSLCAGLGIVDTCVTVPGTGSGILGCCCSWNDCVNKTTGNSLNSNPYALPTGPAPTQLSSSIPFLFTTLLILVASVF
ncbi:unnamed protein product, partial [Mesorhabditis belari]|uniref:Uncharacterized protein n=1 Tax=Mesorhabditis belari TaxID=2138241 RepID=A0AAF3FTX8_9BILA